MKRREFISIPTQALGGALMYTLACKPVRLPVDAPAPDTIDFELRHFTTAQAHIIQAAAARIFPTDENGPGATEAGAVIYIDRQLGGPYGNDSRRYTQGPWETDGWVGHGYQGKENPREIYDAGIESLGADFASLTEAQQDERLIKIEDSMFFGMLRKHTVEGMFCDPLHGGNADLIGWQLLGFPGPIFSYKDRIEDYGKPYRPAPQGLEQIVGHPVKGMEDEDPA